MSSWSELLNEFHNDLRKNPNDTKWLDNKLKKQLSKLRKNSTVVFYASGFLQKADTGSSIDLEDMNGFMNALHGADANKDLTLILHTPGGNPHAVESIVNYLHSKFTRHIETIVPYLAMSGGAMISLASDLLILGRQSQLGPIDPQFVRGGKIYSASAIQKVFNRAKEDIKGNVKLGHLWAPILQNMGPSLVVEAENALSYSKELVANWLSQRMFRNIPDPEGLIKNIADYFNAENVDDHGAVHVHGQMVGLQKLQELKINVELLEADQKLQDSVLTAYHLMTLIFENTASMKFIATDKGEMWTKTTTQ